MKLPTFTLVPQLDRSPRWVARAQTMPGKLCLVAAFCGLLFLHGITLWWLISLYLLTFSLWPERRWQILFAATWSFLLVGNTDFKWERISTLFREAGIPWHIETTGAGFPLILTVLLFSALCVRLVRSGPLAGYLKRPVLALVCFYLGLMLTASYAPLAPSVRAFLWAFLVVLGQYFWFLCYSLKECRATKPPPLILQFGQYLPFWQPTLIPYPKGSGYMRKIEAKSAEEFAICQIKGLKLLLWALWLKLFDVVANITLYGYAELQSGRLQFKRELTTVQLYFDGSYLGELIALPFTGVLPRYETALSLALSGNPLPWYMNWIILVAYFLSLLLFVSVSTHTVIAMIRMCGFNALRNTYRPFASRTIAEFWNRFFYYFKELLVEFFFYPVFFRYFKKHPVLRMYCATMAAAFFGNFLFHFMRDIWFVVELGFFRALGAFHVYFVYSFLLGNMIFLSQWRQERVSQANTGAFSRFFAPVRVFGFYILLSVFIDFRRESIFDNITFLLALLPF